VARAAVARAAVKAVTVPPVAGAHATARVRVAQGQRGGGAAADGSACTHEGRMNGSCEKKEIIGLQKM
jgi:hypothetical protein